MKMSSVEVIDCSASNQDPAMNPDPLAEMPASTAPPVSKKEAKKIVKVYASTECRTDVEDVKTSQELIMRITNYLNSPRFRDYLVSLDLKATPAELRKMSTEQLVEFLERVKVAVNAKNPSGFIQHMTLMGLGFAEQASQHPHIKPRFDLEGLNAHLQQDQEFLDTLAQVDIEYGSVLGLSPEKRILLILGKQCMFVSQVNKLRNKAATQADSLPPNNTQTGLGLQPGPQPGAESKSFVIDMTEEKR